MAKEYARPLMPVKAKLILLTPAATDQNTLNNAKTAQDRKPRCAWQPRTSANMLIGRDAGSTRMASTSALLSDEALLLSRCTKLGDLENKDGTYFFRCLLRQITQKPLHRLIK